MTHRDTPPSTADRIISRAIAGIRARAKLWPLVTIRTTRRPVPVCILGTRCDTCPMPADSPWPSVVHCPRWHFPKSLCPAGCARIARSRPDWIRQPARLPHHFEPAQPYSSARYLGRCEVCNLPRSVGPHLNHSV